MNGMAISHNQEENVVPICILGHNVQYPFPHLSLEFFVIEEHPTATWSPRFIYRIARSIKISKHIKTMKESIRKCTYVKETR